MRLSVWVYKTSGRYVAMYYLGLELSHLCYESGKDDHDF